MLDVKRDDKILEIGCGGGLAVQLIASKLESGIINAVDRSAAMIKLASKRNLEFIESGTARFFTHELSEVRFDAHSFNKIFAFNVGVFLQDSKKEFDVIRSWLTTDGELYIFYQPPYEKTKQIAKQVRGHLRENNFSIVESIFKKLSPASAFCIVAKP